MDKSGKTLKIDFPPRPKSRKQQKERFGRNRKTKNGENCISAMAESLKMKKNCVSATAEIEKTLKITFPTPLEAEKMPQNSFLALRET